MDKDTAIARLKQAQANPDPEDAHIKADEILCDLLRGLGFEDVVLEWEKVDMWYS